MNADVAVTQSTLAVAEYYKRLCLAVDAVQGEGYARKNPALMGDLCRAAALVLGTVAK